MEFMQVECMISVCSHLLSRVVLTSLKVPAWEEYLKSNGFTNCQLVQTFVWRTKQKDQKDQKDETDKLIFACVPYPSRPDGTLLGEVGPGSDKYGYRLENSGIIIKTLEITRNNLGQVLQDADLVQCKLKEVLSTFFILDTESSPVRNVLRCRALRSVRYLCVCPLQCQRSGYSLPHLCDCTLLSF